MTVLFLAIRSLALRGDLGKWMGDPEYESVTEWVGQAVGIALVGLRLERPVGNKRLH